MWECGDLAAGDEEGGIFWICGAAPGYLDDGFADTDCFGVGGLGVGVSGDVDVGFVECADMDGCGFVFGVPEG